MRLGEMGWDEGERTHRMRQMWWPRKVPKVSMNVHL